MARLSLPEVRLQIGQEVTWGTGVAATAKLMGVQSGGTMTPEQDPLIADETGRYGPSAVATQQKLGASAKFSGYASFEDLLYYLIALFGSITPSGSGDPYTWTGAAPYNSAPTMKPYTLEFGPPGASNGWRMIGAILSKLTLKADAGGVWMVDSEWIGKAIEEDITLAVLADRTYELIPGAQTQFAVDAWAGTMGATGITNLLRNWELSIDPKRTMHYYQSGPDAYGPGAYSQGKWTATLKTVVDLDTTNSEAWFNGVLSGLVQKQIAIAGVSGDHSATIQMPALLTSNTSIGDAIDDILTLDLDWTAMYHSTFANFLSIEVLNARSALT